MDSKSLPPRTEPFFPTIFYKTQFCERQAGLPAGLSLASKVAIVTGSNAGLGFESARQLLALNLSRLILAVRSVEKGEAAAAKLCQSAPKAKIEVWKLDMCSYASIQAFAERVGKELTRLDIALLNAGLVKPSKTHNRQLRPLPNRQTPLNPLNPTQPILASFDDAKTFSSTTWYNTSKTLTHLFLWKLTEYVSADDVVVNIVDPGYVTGTESVSSMPKVTALVAKGFAAVTGRSVETGASTYVDAVAVKGRESHGCFLTSCRVHPFVPFLYTPEGKKLMQQLWEETMAELAFASPEEVLSQSKG